MQWEKNSVHLWRYWTKDLQTEFKKSLKTERILHKGGREYDENEGT